MTSYWLPKVLILLGLVLITRLVLRRPKSASHLALRRLAMLVLILFACFAVVFPAVLNSLAHLIGIEKGINLLVYGLVLALFAQMATSYRRDIDAEIRLTRLARAVALADAQRRLAQTREGRGLGTEVADEGAASMAIAETQDTIDIDEYTHERHQ